MKYDHLISARKVAERYGLSKEQIRRRSAERWRDFPAVINIDGWHFYDARALDRWDEKQDPADKRRKAR